ncbi:hypothetical protein [Paenibacillus sp. EKM211P]|uniref:hypothetical protein n=1 Tax=Paenibacillus sp. EKM211P TaxID=1683679 RepID=UPI001EECD723|nr:MULTISPECIES: hypothetical protein [Paenibacillus]
MKLEYGEPIPEPQEKTNTAVSLTFAFPKVYIMELEKLIEIHRRNIQDKLQVERPRTDGQKQMVVALYIAEALNHLRNNLTME